MYKTFKIIRIKRYNLVLYYWSFEILKFLIFHMGYVIGIFLNLYHFLRTEIILLVFQSSIFSVKGVLFKIFYIPMKIFSKWINWQNQSTEGTAYFRFCNLLYNQVLCVLLWLNTAYYSIWFAFYLEHDFLDIVQSLRWLKINNVMNIVYCDQAWSLIIYL